MRIFLGLFLFGCTVSDYTSGDNAFRRAPVKDGGAAKDGAVTDGATAKDGAVTDGAANRG